MASGADPRVAAVLAAAVAGEAEAASTKDLQIRSSVRARLLRAPRARIDRSGEASSDARSFPPVEIVGLP